MMNGEAEAIKAAGERGYEAIVLCVVMFSMIALFGLLIKWFLATSNKRADEASKREEALASRLNTVEVFIQDKLMDLTSKNTAAISEAVKAIDTSARVMGTTNNMIGKLATAITSRKCLADYVPELSDPKESVVIG